MWSYARIDYLPLEIIMSESKIKILIAEDDTFISNDIASLLNSEGYQVIGIAHSEKEAIQHLKSTQVDMAILDIHMDTHESGINIAKHIRTHKNIPFIFLTSFSDKETQAQALQENPYGYLVKPFQEATLLTTINLALSNFNKGKSELNFSKCSEVLTKTELNICKLLCTSLTYEEIGEQSFISLNTVRFHAKNIYLKLNVNSRSELLNLMIEQ